MSASTFPNLYPLQGGLPPAQLKSPLWQEEVAVSLCQQYFGGPDRIAVDTSLFLWNPDDTKSNLFIGSRDNFVTKTVGKRPALIVGVGDQTYPKEVIGDLAHVDPQTGRCSFLEASVGAWEFTCISTQAKEALSLATEIKYFLNAYRGPIARTYGFRQIRVEALGRYQKQPEYESEFGCTVRAPYALEDNFALDQLSLKLSAVRIGLNPS